MNVDTSVEEYKTDSLDENVLAKFDTQIVLSEDVTKEKLEAKRKIIAAKGTRDAQIILSQGLTDQILKVKHIEALLKLAESPNAKIIMTADDTPFLID